MPPQDVVNASQQVFFSLLGQSLFNSTEYSIGSFNDHASLLQLKDLVIELLKSKRLEHGQVQAFATPRRLVVLLQFFRLLIISSFAYFQ